ncbi:MAG: hypothetical protein P4L34_10330 [Paludibacter sp.]|nr:hypothetical protein [Paludibacter sp.]
MALTSLEVDWADFNGYAPTVFNDGFVAKSETKIVSLEQLTKSGDVQKQQKVITTQSLPAALKDLQLQLNPVEGYLKLAGTTLDINREDFGLDKLRDALHTKDVAAIISAGNSFIVHLKRNETALTAKGMKLDAITNIASKLAEIESLKNAQNDLKNKTGRVSSSNIEAGNEIWDTLKLITDTGTALYKGVDSVKQKEYTLSAILKRISNSQKSSTNDATHTTDTPA